uniref:Bacteriophage protein n=1 Tax=Arsenophonus endosymbiont of Trialeurodes vaporariorum TaxID=235567 RepID=A0A3B0M1Z3_9GAMM
MKSGVTLRIDNTGKLFDALVQLGKKEVLVGIPAENSNRDDIPFSNAAIGYLNEFGSPAKNIPARPHLIPGIRSEETKTTAEFKVAAKAILDGQKDKAEQALNRAGQIAVQGVQTVITQSNFTPLDDSTLAARARRGRKGAVQELENLKAGLPPNNANARPLIDTGTYRRAITYVVRKKNANA